MRHNSTIEHESESPNDDRPDYLMGTPYTIAVDTETRGNGNWFDGPEHGAFLATVSDYDSDWWYDLSKPGIIGELHDVILGAERLLLHNASYDVHHLVAAGVCTLDELLDKDIRDTESLARLTVGFNDTPNFRLKSLGTIFVDAEAKTYEKRVKECMVELGLIQKWDQEKIPDDAFYQVWLHFPEALEEYAMKDTRLTYDLYHTLLPRLDKEGNEATRWVFDLEAEFAKTIMRMEHRGIATNQVKVRQLKVDYATKLAGLMDQLKEANGGEELDPNKRSDILPFLLDRGVELTDLTDTGEIRVDKWVLERHSETVPEIDWILDARTAEKFLSTYIGALDGRPVVHTSFRPMQARTGRTSASNPNMQNIPVRSGPEVREVFEARPGHKLVVSDFSSIELRLLAHYMDDDRLWDIINGGDPFLWLGDRVFGTPDVSQWPVARQPLKNGFYALMYGAGGPKLASTIGGGMTPVEGRALAKDIKKVLGKPYYDLIARIKAVVKARGYVRTMGGRPLWIPRGDDGRLKDYVGLNSVIQGSGADIIKLAMLRTEEALVFLGGYPLITVHDEIMSEVPEEHAEEALELQDGAMLSTADICVRGRFELAVAGTICDNYGEAKA